MDYNELSKEVIAELNPKQLLDMFFDNAILLDS